MVDIGPKTYTGEGCTYPPCYEYSVVSDEFEASLFVLARNPADFSARFNTTVLADLKKLGFTKKVNEPLPLYQDSNCVYVPAPTA